MRHTRVRRVVAVLTLLTGLSMTGCTSNVVTDAARSSLTSFLNTLASTAITTALSPQ